MLLVANFSDTLSAGNYVPSELSHVLSLSLTKH